jgi:hypothetical protein
MRRKGEYYLVSTRTWPEVPVCEIELFYAKGTIEVRLVKYSGASTEALMSSARYIPGLVILLDEAILRCHLEDSADGRE